MRLTSRGAVLIEVVIAALLTAILVVASLTGLSVVSRALGRQVTATASARILRAGVLIGIAEWNDLAPRAGDLLSVASGSMVYRAMRASGLGCGLGPDGLLLAAGQLAALRAPVAGRDSLAVLTGPDAWSVAALTAAPSAGTCPNGDPAIELPYDRSGGDPFAGAAWPAAFVIYEIMEVRGYQSGGEWWLGLRSVSSGEVIQPAMGPLAANGLSLRVLDAAGAPASPPPAARQLELRLLTAAGDSITRRYRLAAEPTP